MRHRAFLALLATSVVTLTAWACGGFGEADEPPSNDGGTVSDGTANGDVEPSDGSGGNDGGDATTPGMGTLAHRCPRPPGPTCLPNECERRVLYTPPMPGKEFPYGIATDSSFVYWATLSFEQAGDLPYDGRGTARIMRVDRKGVVAGGTATVIAENQRRALSIAMAGEHVYWAALGGTTIRLRRVRRDCSASCPVEDLPALQLGSEPIARLVAIDDETLVAAADDGTIYVVKLTATSAVVSGNSAASAYPALTATSKEAFVAGAFSTAVARIPAQTSTSVKFGSVPDAGDSGLIPGMSPIATDCNVVYGWRTVGNIWKVGGDGGTATQFAANLALEGVFDMATDEKYVYLGAADGPGALAVAISNGAKTTIVAGNVHRIAVDDVGVYYGDHDRNSGGAMWMMVK